MRVLCVGRHPFLSEHLCRYFQAFGVETIPWVGVTDIGVAARTHDADAIICDYDLLATTSLSDWENDSVLSQLPLIAVRLTRHPGEAHVLDVNGVAGFLYLPTLDPADAFRVLQGVRQKRGGIMPPAVLSWPGSTQRAQLR
jgi:hypothetical protein